jgi:metallo-beta-lactamase family protein
MPVFLDSPMAIEATRIYELDPRLYDEQAREIINEGERLLGFPTLRLLRSGDESRVMNKLRGPAVVIAGSGMATGGRIVHHLLHHLSDSKTHVVIVGYQAHGTLGRRLVEGAKSVRIDGQNVQVNAAVHTLGGMSAHAGQSELMRWLSGVLGQQSAGKGAGARAGEPRIVLTHGEPLPRAALAKLIEQTHRIACEMPVFADEIEC